MQSSSYTRERKEWQYVVGREEDRRESACLRECQQRQSEHDAGRRKKTMQRKRRRMGSMPRKEMIRDADPHRVSGGVSVAT